jgi:hypothetical protein
MKYFLASWEVTFLMITMIDNNVVARRRPTGTAQSQDTTHFLTYCSLTTHTKCSKKNMLKGNSHKKQDTQSTYNWALRSVRETAAAVKSNKYYIFVCLCVCVCV